MIIKCFSTLDKDEDEKLFDQQKVNAIINGIRVQDLQRRSLILAFSRAVRLFNFSSPL